MSIIIGAFEKVEIQAGESIIRQGESADYFYLLVEGTAECYRVSDSK